MNNLAQSEVFSLTLVIGTYLASLALYRKTRISLLHPLITSIFVIIVVLKTMDIEYESFQKGSHLIHFLLGPSVVALGYVLYEQMPRWSPRSNPSRSRHRLRWALPRSQAAFLL